MVFFDVLNLNVSGLQRRAGVLGKSVLAVIFLACSEP